MDSHQSSNRKVETTIPFPPFFSGPLSYADRPGDPSYENPTFRDTASGHPPSGAFLTPGSIADISLSRSKNQAPRSKTSLLSVETGLDRDRQSDRENSQESVSPMLAKPKEKLSGYFSKCPSSGKSELFTEDPFPAQKELMGGNHTITPEMDQILESIFTAIQNDPYRALPAQMNASILYAIEEYRSLVVENTRLRLENTRTQETLRSVALDRASYLHAAQENERLRVQTAAKNQAEILRLKSIIKDNLIQYSVVNRRQDDTIRRKTERDPYSSSPSREMSLLSRRMSANRYPVDLPVGPPPLISYPLSAVSSASEEVGRFRAQGHIDRRTLLSSEFSDFSGSLGGPGDLLPDEEEELRANAAIASTRNNNHEAFDATEGVVTMQKGVKLPLVGDVTQRKKRNSRPTIAHKADTAYGNGTLTSMDDALVGEAGIRDHTQSISGPFLHGSSAQIERLRAFSFISGDDVIDNTYSPITPRSRVQPFPIVRKPVSSGNMKNDKQSAAQSQQAADVRILQMRKENVPTQQLSNAYHIPPKPNNMPQREDSKASIQTAIRGSVPEYNRTAQVEGEKEATRKGGYGRAFQRMLGQKKEKPSDIELKDLNRINTCPSSVSSVPDPNLGKTLARKKNEANLKKG
ncbi:hypothetical protein M501DRAFT_1034223 [Patellaria atrata CBS 101060]|uniref:Uncharacterized protein n=1 Tax=Patellaria atrata CBS 101060 TaxID=1346257 RepID=A0A9P4VLU6_9PEZI|nr:hypothetical protein M501DRAFT_1034223 [Patellaria atrata CBS 101060]